MTARPGRAAAACCAIGRMASVTISAAWAAAAGSSLIACHVVGRSLPGYAAAAALAAVVYVADRWFTSLRLVSRWILPRPGWQVRVARLRDDAVTMIRSTRGMS